MPSVVFDASTLVGALLKSGSIPERALLLGRTHATICLSGAVDAEIRTVLRRPKFQRYVSSHQVEQFLRFLSTAARRVEPMDRVADCRDAKDNKYLELALACAAETIIASDRDLLALDPWRGVRILTAADYVASFEPRSGGLR